MISCEHCDQQVDETNRRELTVHYWTHRVGGPQLIVKYFHGGVHPVCACGCGEQTKYDKRTQTFSVYLQGHNTWQQRLQYGLLKTGEEKPVTPSPRGSGKHPKPLNPVVYCITNTKTGRQYVGLDSYWPARRNYHLGMLRRNVHGNQHLQNSFNRDGEQAFVFSLLERFEDPLEMGKREQYWIDTLDTYHNGYNMTRGGRRD
jgi:GIY-YIG catalytic domain